MQALVAWLCGIVFGVGLAVSGMTNPAKVLAFLDVFGRFDPTLAFVMAGAVAASAAGFAVARRRERAWLGGAFGLPTRRDVDARLLAGATLFGVGWGLVGLCHGPALANLGRGSAEVAIFVGAMLAGVALHRLVTRERSGAAAAPAVQP
jgi:uncharacterized membrane protein YedE/YeeE